MQAAGCAPQGCSGRQRVAHCKAAVKAAGKAADKAAGSRLHTARLQAAGCKAATALLIAFLALLPRGENAVLLQFGTTKSLHLLPASACNKKNLGCFHESRDQKETKRYK